MSINVTAVIKLCELLNDSEYSQDQLQELIGLHPQSMGRWMKRLRDKKLIYIIDWERRGKIWVAIWTWGYMMKDKMKPKPMSSAEYNLRARAKKKLLGLQSSTVRFSERKLHA